MSAEQSTPSPTSPSNGATRRNVSAWVSGALLLLMILAGGYVVFGSMLYSRSDQKDLVPVNAPGARLRGLLGTPVPRVQVDGVRERGNNSYFVRAGQMTMNANKSKDGTWTLRVTTDRKDILTPDQDAAFTARWRITHDGAFAKSLDVTPEQLKQLGEIPGKGGLIVADADRERMRGLIEAYVAAKAPKQDEQTALVAALAQIGETSIEPTRKSLLERVDKIRSILTPDQLAKFR